MSVAARRVASFGTTIFTEVNMLAQRYNALNLGQGKPDFDTPADIVEQLVLAARAGKYNQYAPGPGTQNLRSAIARHAQRFYALTLDPEREVLVTSGATEGIFAAVLGLVDPGDEVILLEPFYDSYVPNVLMAGAVPVFVPLHPPTWTLDPDELRRAFSPRTRLLILNSPHNPTGRVFSHAELELIASLCREHDVTVINDEVYEHLVFDTSTYVPISTLPGMFERTVSVSSAGKMFSATGWKLGWVTGPAPLIEGVGRAHQFITFVVHHPSQEAVAYALDQADTYYETFRSMYTTKRDLLMQALEGTGLRFSAPQGTYFVMADFSAVFQGTSQEFTRYLIQNVGVACIPMETFYSPEHVGIGQNYARFSFCKYDETLIQAKERMAALSRPSL